MIFDNSESPLIPIFRCLGDIVFLWFLRQTSPASSRISEVRYWRTAAKNTADEPLVLSEKWPLLRCLYKRPTGKMIPAFFYPDIGVFLLFYFILYTSADEEFSMDESNS